MSGCGSRCVLFFEKLSLEILLQRRSFPFLCCGLLLGTSGERGGLQGQTLVPCEVECTHRGVGREKEFQEKQFGGNLAGWGVGTGL